MMRLRGRLPGAAAAVDVLVDGAKVIAVEAPRGEADAGGDDALVSPGWIDLQVNGYRGLDLCGSFGTGGPSADADTVAALADLIPAGGAARFLPTVTTNTEAALTAALRAIAAACESSARLARQMPGVHLEGPFINPADGPRGAHPLEAVTRPDWDLFERLQEAAGGRIRLLTLAPELPGALPLIERAVSAGVVVSLGHCAPDSATVAAAVAAGATMSTHLGNGAHASLPRHPNYLWDQLADDRLTAGLIADLHHLPAPVLKCFCRVKGPKRVVLVSDVAALGGMPPGLYNDGRHEVLESGRVNLAGTPFLAGAGHLLNVGIANLARVSDLDEAATAAAVTVNAAAAARLPIQPVAVGASADLTLYRVPAEGPAEILATLLAGEVLYRA